MNNKLLSVAATAALLIGGCLPFGAKEESTSQEVATAIIEKNFTITSTASGTVESEKKIVISNELKWPVYIKSVVVEGTVVERGELIIEFECKGLEDAIDQKTLNIDNAKLALEQAQKQMLIAEKQQMINLEQSKNALQNKEENLQLFLDESKMILANNKDNLKRAEEALTRYNAKGGQKEKLLKDADINITMSTKQLKIAQEKLDFKKSVNKDPKLGEPYSKSEIETDELNLENLKNSLDKAKASKELLIKYDIPQQIRQLKEDVANAKKTLKLYENHTMVQELRRRKTDVKEAKLSLEKTELGREAELKWKKQEIESKKLQLNEHQKRMKELKEDQEKLKVTAERAGLVLYDTDGGRWHNSSDIEVKAGEEIRPRQKLLKIPDMTTLRVKTEIFEALREYVTVKGGETEAKVVEGEIEAYIKKSFETLMKKSMSGQLPKEKFEPELIKIKTDGIIPMIKKAVTEGRMTKKEAKRFYGRLEDREVKMATQMGGKPNLIKINWKDIKQGKSAETTKPATGDTSGTLGMITFDSFAKKTEIPGHVVEASPLPKSTGPRWLKTGTKAYDLYLDVDWEKHGLIPGKNLKPGMSGKVNLVLEEIPEALTIPVLSVYNKKDKYFCKRLIDNKGVETEITIGKMNESRVQILSGLNEGDRVMLVAKSDEVSENGADGDSDSDDTEDVGDSK